MNSTWIMWSPGPRGEPRLGRMWPAHART